MSTPLRRSRAAGLAAALALTLSLAACGEETGAGDTSATEQTDSASPAEPTSEPTTEPTTGTSSSPAAPGAEGPVPVTGNAGVETAVVVAGSEVGGDVSPLAFPLSTRQERKDFTGVFERDFGSEVTRAVKDLDAGEGTLPWGTVVAVGCEGPTSVRIDAGEAGYEVTPTMPKSTVQCLVPVTYVVVFAAPTA